MKGMNNNVVVIKKLPKKFLKKLQKTIYESLETCYNNIKENNLKKL